MKALRTRILAPVENTLAGSVHRCYDLLLESDLAHRGGGGASDRAFPDRRRREPILRMCAAWSRIPWRWRSARISFVQHPEFAACRRKIPREACAPWCRPMTSPARPLPAFARRRSTAAPCWPSISRTIAPTTRDSCCCAPRAKHRERIPRANKLSLVLQLAHKPGSLCGALGDLRATQYQPTAN